MFLPVKHSTIKNAILTAGNYNGADGVKGIRMTGDRRRDRNVLSDNREFYCIPDG
jgi:hypothetical protein